MPVTSRKGRVSRNVIITVYRIPKAVTSRKGRVSRNTAWGVAAELAKAVTSRKGRVSRNKVSNA